MILHILYQLYVLYRKKNVVESKHRKKGVESKDVTFFKLMLYISHLIQISMEKTFYILHYLLTTNGKCFFSK